MMALRRITTPATPIVKRMALRKRAPPRGSV
jgi:hypothetical protein